MKEDFTYIDRLFGLSSVRCRCGKKKYLDCRQFDVVMGRKSIWTLVSSMSLWEGKVFGP
jgi:hypothetical protein